MKRTFRIAAGLALFSLFLLMAAAPTLAQRPPHFVPPDVIYASDIPYAAATAAAGVVTLAVNLDEGANIVNVQVLRDIPALTSPALVAVRGWTYAPASLDGQHVRSSLLVNVVFDPAYLQLNNVPLAPAEPFQPPDPKARRTLHRNFWPRRIRHIPPTLRWAVRWCWTRPWTAEVL